MSRVRSIQVRLTTQQHERIKNDAKLYGFGSVSEYLRYLALARNQVLEGKIVEMHKILTGRAPRKTEKIGPYRPFI